MAHPSNLCFLGNNDSTAMYAAMGRGWGVQPGGEILAACGDPWDVGDIVGGEMKTITGGRATGKTTEMIRLCADNGGYIVCRSKVHADRILQMAQDMKVNIPRPLTFGEFLDHQYYGLGIGKFHIDDVDALLQSLTHVPIESISINGPHKEAGVK